MGTLFQCPLSGLLFDEDEVEFQVYEEVDHTEKQAYKAATGAVMQGLLRFKARIDNFHICCSPSTPTFWIIILFQGIPANPRKDDEY